MTHWMAKRWSSRPAFPRTLSLSGRERKPRTPSLYKNKKKTRYWTMKLTRCILWSWKYNEMYKNYLLLSIAQCSGAFIFKVKVFSKVHQVFLLCYFDYTKTNKYWYQYQLIKSVNFAVSLSSTLVPSLVNLHTCSSMILPQHPHSRPSNGRHKWAMWMFP